MKYHRQFMRIVAAMICVVAVLMTPGCGPDELDAWEYSIDVANGHTVIKTEGFDLWFEGRVRGTRTKGRLLVVGIGTSEKREKGSGDGIFTHQFTNGALEMSLYGNTFKVTHDGTKLVIAGESFDVGREAHPIVLLRSDGTAKLGQPSELTGGVVEAEKDGKGKDGGKPGPDKTSEDELKKPL